MNERSSTNKRPGRYNPNYHPSGKGSYYVRWRVAERRERAVSRQKRLCESGKLTKEGNVPMDWRLLLPKAERDIASG